MAAIQGFRMVHIYSHHYLQLFIWRKGVTLQRNWSNWLVGWLFNRSNKGLEINRCKLFLSGTALPSWNPCQSHYAGKPGSHGNFWEIRCSCLCNQFIIVAAPPPPRLRSRETLLLVWGERNQKSVPLVQVLSVRHHDRLGMCLWSHAAKIGEICFLFFFIKREWQRVIKTNWYTEKQSKQRLPDPELHSICKRFDSFLFFKLFLGNLSKNVQIYCHVKFKTSSRHQQ